jgi:hypothetical protein
MSRESRFFGSRQWRSAGGLLRCLDNRPDERGDPAENRPAQYEDETKPREMFVCHSLEIIAGSK